MSFFGFDATLPRDRGHPVNAPGFGQALDPFAGLSSHDNADEDDGIDFEDTYDGLGDQLDERDDAFNDETFGGGEDKQSSSQKPVGRDFDFFGQTAKVSNAINEEQARFARQQLPPKSSLTSKSPPKQSSKPARTGYEKYKEPNYITDLQVNQELWGVQPKKPSTPSHVRQQSSVSAAPAKKMMSLEEVEAAMRSKPKPAATQLSQAPQLEQNLPSQPRNDPNVFTSQPFNHQLPLTSQGQLPAQPYAVKQLNSDAPSNSTGSSRAETPWHGQMQGQPQQILQRHGDLRQIGTGQTPSPQPSNHENTARGPFNNAAFTAAQQRVQPSPLSAQNLQRPPTGIPLITTPEQLLHLNDEDRQAFLVEDAKRAKRNHKIYLLSKYNGLMTPQDKNFIGRIQLQQLVTATGNPNEPGTDASLAEDFYYQVHSQIRGGPRQNPHQPLSNFAQTYLFQTGGRIGHQGRRHQRGADNHMQRMEQQVQRAVDAAKAKPKSKQLVIEGSLGKISFSNAKTPKPLLNVKRIDQINESSRPSSIKPDSRRDYRKDKRHVLRSIETVYDILMKMEDLERRAVHITADSDPEDIQKHLEWTQTLENLNKKLWNSLKVMQPIDANSPTVHPFIAFLSHAKGKKAMPRIFRHIDQEQKLFMITIIFVHLGHIDAVKLAQIQPDNTTLSPAVKEEVELFSQAVIPSIFSYINEAPLNVISGLFGLIMNSVNVQALALTKVGIMILTTLISRAELLKQAGEIKDSDWTQWLSMYNRFFDTLEPVLAHIFPGSVHSGEDMYIWQFLAAAAIGGSPEQQQRLVLGVRERVLDTVKQAKTLPTAVSAQRISNVNLFMRALGLDVDKLG